MAEAAPPPPEPPATPESPRGGLGRLSPPKWAWPWLEARRAGLRPWGSFLAQRRFGVPRDFGELCRRLAHNAERFQSNYLLLFLGLVIYCLDFGELCRRLAHNAERFQSNYLLLFLGLVIYCLDFGELCRRLAHNAERFQSNYLLLFLGLVLYCLATSPLLLVAISVFVAAVVAVRSRERPLVLLGRELSPAHQVGVAGGVSLPLFWLAGAGAALFWVLGAALVFLGSHAAFRQLDPPESPELQMEPV